MAEVYLQVGDKALKLQLYATTNSSGSMIKAPSWCRFVIYALSLQLARICNPCFSLSKFNSSELYAD